MKISVVLCCLIMAIPVLSYAGEKEDLADECLNLTGVQKAADMAVAQMSQVYDQLLGKIEMSEKQKQRAVELQNKLQQLILDELNWEKIKTEYIMLYANTYTIEELKGMIQFYGSEVGQSIMQKLPIVTQKSMLMIQEKMQAIIPKGQKLIQDFENSTD